MTPFHRLVTFVIWLPLLCLRLPAAQNAPFEGRFFRGEGDVDYLLLLETARSMFAPDPNLQNLAMLYMPAWNGLVEGPTWDAWWIQNSYGTTYSALPFLQEPFVTFLQNSQDLWFDQMGDGKRVGAEPPFNWVAPDGCLCDAARPGWIVYRQGDGRTHLHDWGLEFTAAGLLMQSELLLISRDPRAIAKYLPKLERCANFIETRRDPTNNLFLVGAAGNLLAPSFAGWKKPDGTYGKAYLTGLSVTYIAALDRLIEVEKLAGRTEAAKLWAQRRDSARTGLAQMTTSEGYFINSLDPDGARHGIFGAPRHGYFESSPNHDAIAFRVADDAQARQIYAKIASIPGLRPHHFILPNYPSYDDMYEKPEGLWAFGTWVNGGHWSTCEARMMLGYYRLGQFQDARRSLLQLLGFAERFRMDNPLVKFGSEVYQPGQPINLTYDAFGPPAAFVRGLFEYLYRADELTLLPHIPPGITRLTQRFPIRFGSKQLFLATVGTGSITAVAVNGQPWKQFDSASVRLLYDQVPERASIEIGRGGARLRGNEPPPDGPSLPPVPANDAAWRRLRQVNLSTNGLPLRIGADSAGASRFMGEIMRARIFHRALNTNEIAALSHEEAGSLKSDSSLVADWTFENRVQETFSSKSPGHLKAKAVGKLDVADGPAGRALKLDGEGYLEVPRHPSLDLSEACTLEAWIRPEQLPSGGGRIIDKSGVGTSDGFLLDTYPGNSLRLICQAGSLSYDARLAPGKWVHVAATVAPDGQLALYIDGRQVAQKAGDSMPDIASLLATGERLRQFHRLLAMNGLAENSKAAHARLALECLATAHTRLRSLDQGMLKPLANRASQAAADRLYVDTARKLADGLGRAIAAEEKSTDPKNQQVADLWRRSLPDSR
jgi:hypothetical protein